MTTVEINGQQYNLDWNFFAQLQMERITKAVPAAMDTPIGEACILIWSAIHGGTENFSEDPDWILRSCGKDAAKFKELNLATQNEINAFRRYNEKLLEPKKKKAVQRKEQKNGK